MSYFHWVFSPFFFTVSIQLVLFYFVILLRLLLLNQYNGFPTGELASPTVYLEEPTPDT